MKLTKEGFAITENEGILVKKKSTIVIKQRGPYWPEKKTLLLAKIKIIKSSKKMIL